MSQCYKDTFVLNKILFHVALLSFNLKNKRFPDESTYLTSKFLFKLNIVQFIIFPYKVFNNENEIRFLKSILNRKGYV